MKIKNIWKIGGAAVSLAAFAALNIGCKDCQTHAQSTEKRVAPEPLERLIEKLEVVSVESDIWLLGFRGIIGHWHQFNFKFKPSGGRLEENRNPASKAIAIGDIIFTEGPGKGRFKLLETETREEEGRFGRVLRRRAIVEDQSEHKKGRTYELKYQVTKAEMTDQTRFDHTVTFKLDKKQQFKIEENSTFSIPPGGGEKPFRLVDVTLEEPYSKGIKALSVTVEYQVNGETKSRVIPVP